MFKNLIGRAASAASNAVQALDDMLSLPPSGEDAVEEFVYYWDAVQREHTELVEAQALAHAQGDDPYEDDRRNDPHKNSADVGPHSGASPSAASPRRRRSTVLLRESNIRENLEQLVTILRDEDAAYAESRAAERQHGGRRKSTSISGGGTEPTSRPCIEYMLDNHVMEILCAMGLADQPRGMMGLVLQVVKLLLQHITHPLIPHISVHRPINHLIHVCMEARTVMHSGSSSTPGHKASYRMQSSLISLLAEIWRKIEADPSLVRFFFHRHLETAGSNSSPFSSTPALNSPSSSRTSVTSSTSPHHTQKMNESGSKRRPKMLIFTALLPFIQLHKRRTGAKARSAVLSALSLREAPLLDFIAHQTLFCRRLSEGLGAAYIALPSTLEVRSGHQQRDRDKFHSEFVDRLQFCNAVMMACLMDGSGAVLAEHLCRNLHRWFLVPCLLPALSSVNESAQIAAMTYTALMIEVVHETTPSSALLTLFSRFLLGLKGSTTTSGPDSNKEKAEEGGSGSSVVAAAAPAGGNVKSQELRALLIHRINSQVAAVSYAAMELFNMLLELSGPAVLRNLLLEDKAVVASSITAAMEASEAKPQQGDSGKSDDAPATPVAINKNKHVYATPDSGLMSPTAVFLSKFQDSPKPAPGSSSRPLIFEDYLTDAHTQSVARMAAYWSSSGTVAAAAAAAEAAVAASTPDRKAISPTVTGADNMNRPSDVASPTMKVNVGLSFLDAIYDKLEGMLDETMDENLVLTSILSKLLQCPNQLLHNTLLRDAANVETRDDDGDGDGERSCDNLRSLVTVLREVWQEGQERAADIEGFPEAVQAHRKRLGTAVDGCSAPVETEQQLSVGGNSGKGGSTGSGGQSQFCESFIVLEEFVKELSAIIQARIELGCVKVPDM